MLEWEAFGIVVFVIYCSWLFVFRLSPTLPNLPIGNGDSKKRDLSWDVLRGFAITGIVCIHIHSYFQYFHPEKNWISWFTVTLSNISRFSVPVFIFASGLFFQKKPGYWSSKFWAILLPYSVACVLAYPIKHWGASFQDFGFSVLTGQVFTPYYFVPLLFQFYGILYLLPITFASTALCIALLPASFFIQFFSNMGYFDPLFPEFYKSINVLDFLFFFHLGYLAKEHSNQARPRIDALPVLLTLVLLIFMLIWSSANSIEHHNHHLTYPLFMISFLWLVFDFFKDNQNHFFFTVTSKLGKESLFIFLFHPFVIHAMHSIDPFSMGGPIIAYLITLVLNLSIPMLIPLTLSTLRNRVLVKKY